MQLFGGQILTEGNYHQVQIVSNVTQFDESCLEVFAYDLISIDEVNL